MFYSKSQWGRWLNGQSRPPRQAVKKLTKKLLEEDIAPEHLVDLWGKAFVPAGFPQAPGATAATLRDIPWRDAAMASRADRLGMMRPVPQRDDLLALRRVVSDATRLRLTALTGEAVTGLVAALAGGQPDGNLLELAGGAAGNPLYVTELVAALARGAGLTVTEAGAATLASDSAPSSLSAAIADRLGFVARPTREALKAAALLGAEFAVPDLAIVLGRGVPDLIPAVEEACAAGHEGALPEALATLTDGFDGNTEEIQEMEDLLPDAVRLATETGDLTTATALADHAGELAAGSQIAHRQANALYCRGLLDHDAPRLLAAAARYHDASRPLLRAKALEAAAGNFIDAGDRGQARAAFARAEEDYTALGAAADVVRLKSVFRAHGIGAGPLRAASASFGTSAHDQGGDHQLGQGPRRPDDRAQLSATRRELQHVCELQHVFSTDSQGWPVFAGANRIPPDSTSPNVVLSGSGETAGK